MKKLIRLFVGIFFVMMIILGCFYVYHRTHKTWIPAEEQNTLDDVILVSEKSTYSLHEPVVSFSLTNNSLNRISFGVNHYYSEKQPNTYQVGESNIVLQKWVNGSWCSWDIPDKYKTNKHNSGFAGIDCELAAGQSDGPFLIQSNQFLPEIKPGKYRAVFSYVVLEQKMSEIEQRVFFAYSEFYYE